MRTPGRIADPPTQKTDIQQGHHTFTHHFYLIIQQLYFDTILLHVIWILTQLVAISSKFGVMWWTDCGPPCPNTQCPTTNENCFSKLRFQDILCRSVSFYANLINSTGVCSFNLVLGGPMRPPFNPGMVDGEVNISASRLQIKLKLSGMIKET